MLYTWCLSRSLHLACSYWLSRLQFLSPSAVYLVPGQSPIDRQATEKYTHTHFFWFKISEPPEIPRVSGEIILYLG